MFGDSVSLSRSYPHTAFPMPTPEWGELGSLENISYNFSNEPMFDDAKETVETLLRADPKLAGKFEDAFKWEFWNPLPSKHYEKSFESMKEAMGSNMKRVPGHFNDMTQQLEPDLAEAPDGNSYELEASFKPPKVDGPKTRLIYTAVAGGIYTMAMVFGKMLGFFPEPMPKSVPLTQLPQLVEDNHGTAIVIDAAADPTADTDDKAKELVEKHLICKDTAVTFDGTVLYDQRGPTGKEGEDVPPYFGVAISRGLSEKYDIAGWMDWDLDIQSCKNTDEAELNKLDKKINKGDGLKVTAKQVVWSENGRETSIEVKYCPTENQCFGGPVFAVQSIDCHKPPGALSCQTKDNDAALAYLVDV